MNLRRSFDGQLRKIRFVAGVGCCLAAATLQAQSYGLRYPNAPTVPAYGAPAGIAPAYYAQPQAAPRMTVPAGYRSPILNARRQPAVPYCPPGQQPPGYTPYPQAPGMQPGQRLPPVMQDGTQPRSPADTSDPNRQTRDPSQPQDTTQQPQNQQQQNQQQQTQQQNQQQQQQDQQQQPTDLNQSADSGRANPSPGMNTPQLGRADQINRLNLFDNMTARPQSRVWMGTQTVRGFDTGLQFTDEFKKAISPVLSRSISVSQNDIVDQVLVSQTLDAHGCTVTNTDTYITRTRTETVVEVRRNTPADVDQLLRDQDGIDSDFFEYDQRLYRVGAEWAPKDWLSIAVQGQRYNSDSDGPGENWTNPQIMVKLVVAEDCDTILSATLGIIPQIEAERGVINETTTKLYPGLLFYEGITPKLFCQGGAQVGIPTETDNQVHHADWSLALGYWLYQDPSYTGRGCGSLLQRFRITGIVPQINLLGKHTIGNRKIIGPFGFSSFAPPLDIDATRVEDTTVMVSQEISRSSFTVCPDNVRQPDVVIPVNPPVVPLQPDCGCGVIAAPVFSPTVFTQTFPNGFIIYEEPGFVLDLTVGGTVTFGQGLQLGGGYSFPLTETPVRQGEFLGTISYTF